MLLQRTGLLILMLYILVSCAAAPPVTHVVSHDSMLDRQEGVLLLADVCIQRDGIGKNADYFMIAESKYGAEAGLAALRTYVVDSGMPIRAEVPIACAAKHGDQATILVGDLSGGSVHNVAQPIYAEASVLEDADYTKALSVISTYAFERAAHNKEISNESNEGKIRYNVSTIDFLDAADEIKSRAQVSSILYLGVLGSHRTGGLAVAEYLGSVTVGVVVGVATGGIVVGRPGMKFHGRFMKGALIDLESGELTWSNKVMAKGDPAKSETWSNLEPLYSLFHDLFFQRTSVQ